MATVTTPIVYFDNAAEVLDRLGGVPPERVLMRPPPGTAREKDLIARLDGSNKRLCELVDGVLVEKTMGIREARLALVLGQWLNEFAHLHGLGIVFGADGPIRILPGMVRVPDVSFVRWDRLPGEELPDEPILDVVPDLAVEVISRGNTKKEMERKLRNYFEAGVRLVWLIYPKTQAAEAFTSPKDMRRIGKRQSLDGADVLPGFRVALPRLFASTRPPRPGG
jgi:Uma2 family endonuclease